MGRVVIKAPFCYDNVAVNNYGLLGGYFVGCKYIKYIEIGMGN